LEGVDLDGATGVGLGRVVFPNDLAVGLNFLDAGPALLQEDISIGQQRCVVDGSHGNLPLDRAIGGDDGEASGGIIGGEDAASGCLTEEGGGESQSEGQRCEP
jgi:hypothetical protein